MKINTLEENDQQVVLDYMERYVNDGSPSGFTLHDQLSPKTNPLGLEPFFHPFEIDDVSKHSISVFRSRFFPCPDIYQRFYIHPDAIDVIQDMDSVRRVKSLRLVPTSSGRTSRVLDDRQCYYLKMGIPKTLGRVDRSLPRHKTCAGIEVSDEIVTAISNGAVPNNVAILPEVCGVAVDGISEQSMGMVVRRGEAFPLVHGPKYTIPLFSLWSFDKLSPLDIPILNQIFHLSKETAEYIVIESGKAIVRFFFELWLSRGLLYEVNAQNVLVELDRDFSMVRVLFRDFNSVEKDVLRREYLDLPNDFISGTYKRLDGRSDGDNLQMRRSFSFDFKLAHYGIAPLIDALARLEARSSELCLSEIKNEVRKYLNVVQDDFFPALGEWWSHPEVDLTNKRPYQRNHGPYLR